MKLRVRFGPGRRVAVVDVPGAEPTVGDAVEAARAALSRQGYDGPASFNLSLDGRTTLARGDTLAAAGIVSGDLVRVVSQAPIKVTCTKDDSWRRPSAESGIPPELRDYLRNAEFASGAEPYVALFNYWMLQHGFEPAECGAAPNDRAATAAGKRGSGSDDDGAGTSRKRTQSRSRSRSGSRGRGRASVTPPAPGSTNRYPFREPRDPLPPNGSVSSWRRSPGTYVLAYRHVLCPDRRTEVLVSAMLPKLIVQGMTDAGPQLDAPFDVVVDTRTHDAAADLTRARCLEVLFKDRIAVPLLAANQTAAGVAATGLSGLPDELVEAVMGRCDPGTRGNLAAVNERFWDVDARLRNVKAGKQHRPSSSRDGSDAGERRRVKPETLTNLFL